MMTTAERAAEIAHIKASHAAAKAWAADATTPLSARGASHHVRVAAEHEAAHVIVAQLSGIFVREAVVRHDGSGHTDLDLDGVPARRALPSWLAGDLWCERYASVAISAGYQPSCGDRRHAAQYDDWTVRQALADAHRILAERQDMVLALANELETERRVTWTQYLAAS